MYRGDGTLVLNAGRGAVAGGRLAYLDNLKVLLVAGMIGVHTAITYGVDGSWYLEDYKAMAGASIAVWTVFVVLGYLFGLGAFFLLAWRLSGPSLARGGPRRFVRDRLIRLGVPVLFYVLLIAPAMEYVTERHEGGEQDFASFAWGQLSDPAPGPTWFLEALLVFSLVFALVAALRPVGWAPRETLRWPQVAQVGAAICVRSRRRCRSS